MKKFFILISTAFLLFAVSCSNSPTAALKTITKKVNAIAEKVEKAQTYEEFEKLAEQYSAIINDVPKELNEMSEEEVSKLEGFADFMKAQTRVETAMAEATAKMTSDAMSGLKNLGL